MDRGKSSSSSRGAKSKITQYPPDIFALGSKPTSSRDSDVKKHSQHKSSSSSSKVTSERKREHSSSSLPTVATSKKQKVGNSVIRAVNVPTSSASGGISTDRVATSSQSLPTVEFWETFAIDCEPCDLVVNVAKAWENNDTDKVVSYLSGAVKSLRNQRYKPEKVLYLSLLYLAKARPSLFLNDHIVNAFASLLRRDSAAHSFKSKGNPAVPVLCANLLLRAHIHVPNWPELFVRLYVDDALGDRIWVDHEECKGFVDNIITAFNTRIPPKALLTPELSGTLGSARDTTSSPIPSSTSSSTAGDDDGGRNTPDLLTIAGEMRENADVPIQQRYSQSYEVVEQIVLEAIKEQLNRSRQPPDTITRNFLRLLSSACGLVEIRIIAVSRLEMWLHNPKLMRPAQELLAYLSCNCASVTARDMEVTAHITKIRLKTKALLNVYLNCLRELVILHPDNLPSMLKHTIYNELSNSRNPNNMAMITGMFQVTPEVAANVLADIFQELLINKDDYLRSLRALLREIVRVLRFDINLFAFCRSLLHERKDITTALRDFDFRDRVFLGITDLLCLCMFLGVSPQVKEAAQLLSRGDKKELATLQSYQHLVAKIQQEAITWIHESVLRIFRPNLQDYVHVLRKLLLLEPAETYYKIDTWPSESDRTLLLRLASEVPLLQTTLIRVLLIGVSKEHPLSVVDSIDITDQLIKRAALLPTDTTPGLQADKLEIVDFIFNLTRYHYPENISLPPGYTPPELAISTLYWKSWIMLLMLSAHNPATIGALAWKKYPMLRNFMEMCITNHFSYPPPTVTMGEAFDDLKNKELQIVALERQQILEFECHLAAHSTKTPITEQNSLLLPQLIEMKPAGESRQPPQLILDQLQSLNASHRMGHLLCRSRHPDFLLDIIQRQGSSQHMPWLADLVHNSEGALSNLPVQCLCEYLLISGMNQSSDKNEKHKKQGQVLAHLQTVLSDPAQDVNAACEVLEYFLRRLTSLHFASRVQAIKALKSVLQTVIVPEDETMDEDAIEMAPDLADYWLLKQIPALPHFQSIRLVIVGSLRQACQVETDPIHISSYIHFLAQQTCNEPLTDMLDLVLDMAQLIVERSTIIAAVLPIYEQDKRAQFCTLHSLMSIFCAYLRKAKEPRQSTYAWSESQDQVLITWASGEECTMHILVVHAMIILLTHGSVNDQELFESLLDSWFPLNDEPPKAFLVDTSEEALLIPDWLKLRMIRSSVSRLVDAALVNLEPSQLVLFIQSFGIPVSSMSKLLCMLDLAVTVDESSVGEAVLDKCYMAQLVEVQHRRGAIGGNTFVQVLQLIEPKLPDETEIETGTVRQQLPVDLTIIKNPNSIDTDSTIILLNAIFLKLNYDGDVDKEFRILIKNLSQEIYNKNCLNKQNVQIILEILALHLNSKQFMYNFVEQETYSCVLLRLILSTKTNNRQLLDLTRALLAKIADKKSSVAVILKHFIRKQQILTNYKTNTEIAEKDPIEILKNTDLVSLERTTKCLVEKSLEKSDNVNLVNSMAKLLLTDYENSRFERTGLLVDWIAELEMEIIGTSPDLQMELLFAKNPKLLSQSKHQTWMSFRPYLLTLLTHRVSWRALHTCVQRLLTECVLKYDPAAVLDFLWALTCNPKLWQGRDKFTPKHYKPEDVLQLENEQIVVLVSYILQEATVANNIEPFSDKNSIHKIEQRLPLLLQCLGDRDSAFYSVVRHLVTIMTTETIPEDDMDIQIINLDESLTEKEQNSKTKSKIAEEFLILLYMRVPKIIQYIPSRDRKDMRNISKITEFSTSIIDNISHGLLTALASTPRSKDWIRKSQEFELLARKMAAVHPALVLRQLPMVAASLKGRTHLDFGVFKSRHHLNLFNQILGIIELLQPTIFEQEYRVGLEGILMAYFSLFRFHGHVKELHTILGKFVSLLQTYVAHDATRALKYLQQHARLLNHLHLTYVNMRSLSVLMSSISLPKDDNPLVEMCGEGGEVLVAVARALSPEPMPPNWANLVQNIGVLQDDELPNILQEIEHLSNRRPALLETIINQLCPLIISSCSAVRQLGHVLLLRYLKHNSSSVDSSSPILSAVLQALESRNSDVVNNLLDKLSDYIVSLQEHAVRILEKVFVLGVKSNINTSTNIIKAISVLNIQSGC